MPTDFDIRLHFKVSVNDIHDPPMRTARPGHDMYKAMAKHIKVITDTLKGFQWTLNSASQYSQNTTAHEHPFRDAPVKPSPRIPFDVNSPNRP